MRLAAFVLPVLVSCSPAAAPQQAEAAGMTPCAEFAERFARAPAECQLEAGGQTLHIKFEPGAAGAEGGTVSIDVLGEAGAVVQTMLERDVLEFIAPKVQDIDGDGRADILAGRESGNVNTTYGVWVFSGAHGVYERAGEVSAVQIERTADGLIAAVARSSAVAWAIEFSKLDESGLRAVATVYVTAPETEGGSPTCELQSAPGLSELNLTERAARDRFCAEPAAQVFSP